MDDAEAIQRVLDGDVEAFSILVRKYHARCTGYARRMLRNRELAEDVVQETFVRAFRGLRGYDDRNRFAAWLLRILANRCRSALKAEARGRFRSWDDLPAPPEPQTTAPDNVTPRAVENAVSRLPAEQREAFLLRHVEQLSYEEMRAVTGAGVSALKMRVARACEALRREFGHG
jgi:RNA polymerase sigma-70 factor, ECF subfamily